MTSVSIEVRGSVRVVTIDDGKVNAFSKDLVDELHAIWDDLPRDSGAVILRGRPKIFSAGFDLVTIQGDPSAAVDLVTDGLSLLLRIATFPRPVVVQARGHVVALGALITLTGDWRVGAEGDYALTINEVRDGLPLPSFVRDVVQHYLRSDQFAPVFLHGKVHTPYEAVAAGILNEVVPHELSDALALDKAQKLAALPHPSYASAKAYRLAALSAAAEGLAAQVAGAFAGWTPGPAART